jgi:hypothetical protein
MKGAEPLEVPGVETSFGKVSAIFHHGGTMHKEGSGRSVEFRQSFARFLGTIIPWIDRPRGEGLQNDEYKIIIQLV